MTRVDNVQGPPILPEMNSKKEVGRASNTFCPGATKHLVTPLRMCTRINAHANSTFQYIEKRGFIPRNVTLWWHNTRMKNGICSEPLYSHKTRLSFNISWVLPKLQTSCFRMFTHLSEIEWKYLHNSMSRRHFTVKTQHICFPLVFLPKSKNKPLVFNKR